MPLDPNQDRSFALLMRQAQLGDKNAYNQLLVQVAILLKGYFLRRVGSPEESEDLIQETLLSIHGSRHSYNSEKRFLPWMFTIARFRLADYWRKQIRRIQNEISAESNLLEKAPNAELASPFHHEKLDGALRTLTEKQRKIVQMLKVEGYSLQETAAKLEMTVPAVKVTAHRAYKALRKQFLGDSNENE